MHSNSVEVVERFVFAPDTLPDAKPSTSSDKTLLFANLTIPSYDLTCIGFRVEALLVAEADARPTVQRCAD